MPNCRCTGVRKDVGAGGGDLVARAGRPVSPARAPAMHQHSGIKDIVDGLRSWPLALRLGWMDIARRYRRTRIGPFWGTLSVAAFIGTMGFLYSGLFGQDPEAYLPYLSSGFAVWIPLSSFVNESAGAFLAAESVVKQSSVPFSTFVWQGVVRNFIVFFHYVQVFVFVAIVFHVEVSLNTFLVLPGLLLLFINAGWVGIMVALFCTRFRDLQQLLATLMQMLFFLTPIFWMPGQAGRVRTIFVDLNPAHHFVDIVRSPMLGQAPHVYSWLIVIGFAVLGWGFTLAAYSRYRHRMVLWM